MPINVRDGTSDGLDAWINPDWPAPPHVHAMVATQRGAGPAVDHASLREALALPSEPCWLRQVHGTRVVTFDRPRPALRAWRFAPPPPLEGEGAHKADGENATKERSDEPEADASVTRTPGVVLAIKTADCLPVLFCADNGSEIAAAHAGWRGLSAGVLENTLGVMQTPRENILAWLGPAIAAQSYEVGDEVRASFLAHDSATTSAFTATRSGHWLCDLYALARQRLQAAGVARIFGGGLDTFTDPRLHSYRRDGAHSGRMVSLVWTLPATG
jgi:hypothetical protein